MALNGGFLHYKDIKKFFKILLFWNSWSDFETISWECFFQKVVTKFWLFKKHGSRNWGLITLYRHEGILKNSSSLKPLVRFWNNFAEMFIRWLLKICLQNVDASRIMALVNGSYLHFSDMKEFLEILPWNYWSDFEIISKRCTLNDSRKKSLAKFLSIRKHGSVEWRLLVI